MGAYREFKVVLIQYSVSKEWTVFSHLTCARHGVRPVVSLAFPCEGRAKTFGISFPIIVAVIWFLRPMEQSLNPGVVLLQEAMKGDLIVVRTEGAAVDVILGEGGLGEDPEGHLERFIPMGSRCLSCPIRA